MDKAYISTKKDLVIACFSHGDYTPGVSVAFLSRSNAKSFDKIQIRHDIFTLYVQLSYVFVHCFSRRVSTAGIGAILECGGLAADI